MLPELCNMYAIVCKSFSIEHVVLFELFFYSDFFKYFIYILFKFKRCLFKGEKRCILHY